MKSHTPPALTVARLGERALIARLARYMAPAGDAVLVSVGDDCAVLAPPSEPVREVLTTDMLVEGTHFLRNGETDWPGLGHKAVAANVSDVASMGAKPVSILVSLGLPPELPVADLEAFYQGMAEEACASGAALVGGDVTRSPILVISLAVTGHLAPGSRAALRSACLPGQAVYVSGALGGSLAGLRLLTEPACAPLRTAPFAERLVRRHWRPEPRVTLGLALAASCPDLAMLDISDGLSNELHLMAEASGMRIEIDLDAVPVWPGVAEFAEATTVPLDHFRLFSGEEYELLFATALPEAALRKRLTGIDPPVTRIGAVREGTGVAFLRQGRPVQVADQTFSHFEKSAPARNSLE